MGKKYHVLIVEDLPADVELARREISQVLPSCTYHVVDTREEFLESVENFKPDLIVSDYRMPDFDGLTALQLSLEKNRHTPFIILTGSMNEETAVECMRLGAWDYVIKEHIRRLGPAILRALEKKELRIDREKINKELEQNEERFRSLFENATIGLYRTTPDGKILMANPALVQMLGFDSLEELRERNLEEEGYEPDYPRSDFKKRLEREGKIIGYEASWKCKNGSTIFVRESCRLVYDKNGNPQFYEGTVENISERKKAEKALEQSEKKYRELVENSVVGVIQTDIDGNVFYLNNAMVSILEFDAPDDLRSNKAFDFYKRPSDRYQFVQQLKKYGKVDNFEAEMVTKKGNTRHIILSATLNRNIISGMVRDVTDYRSLQQQLIKSQKLESIGTLASGIAHDFNNILSIIIGHSHILNEVRSDDEKFSKSISALEQASNRGAALVQKMMTFAQKSESIYEAKNINELIREMESMIKETLPRFISIKTQLDENIPVIAIDPTQFQQVLLNLCVNARDAMSKGGVLTIKSSLANAEYLPSKFQTAPSSQYVCIEVSDTGAGMDEYVLRRIFEPFYTTKEKGKGTGLGLPVAYGVVENHGGFIDVESEVGKGTAFYLYFPVNLLAGIVSKEPEILLADEAGGTETILLVEDEELLLEIIKSVFKRKGYTVIEALNGDEAIEVFSRERSKISLVLSDLGLPRMTGSDVYKKLKDIDPTVKFILGSGYISPEQKSEMMKLGVNHFIQKPYDPAVLLKLVRSVLDR